MGITSITRDWPAGTGPAMVRITTTSTLSQVGVASYLTAQADDIDAANNGAFEWLYNDFVLVYASDGWAFFTISTDFTSLTLYAAGNTANVLQYASVAITATEFKGMYAAPKLLIAAPGANKLIMVERMELIMTYGSAAYAGGGVVAAQYDSTVHGAGVLATNSEAAADFFVTASTTFAFTGISGNTVGALPFSSTVNKGLYLSNATGAFITGDSAVVADVHYRVIATA